MKDGLGTYYASENEGNKQLLKKQNEQLIINTKLNIATIRFLGDNTVVVGCFSDISENMAVSMFKAK
jgi:hypothetical protein